MNAKTWFEEKLPKHLEQSPEKAKETNAIFLFQIAGEGGGQWTVNLKSDPPTVQEGDAGNSECTIEMESEDFEAMLSDFQVAMQLYFQGKLKVTGDPMLATKLQSLFAPV